MGLFDDFLKELNDLKDRSDKMNAALLEMEKSKDVKENVKIIKDRLHIDFKDKIKTGGSKIYETKEKAIEAHNDDPDGNMEKIEDALLEYVSNKK